LIGFLKVPQPEKYTIRENMRKENDDLVRYFATPREELVKTMFGTPSSMVA
jgi:hypothetical protein